MVVFGIPRHQDDAPARAIKVAYRMQRALEIHNRTRRSLGLPAFRHGIGVHFGTAIVGNIGTRDRLEYTAIGNVVNIASRLERATKTLGVPVVISRDAVDAAYRNDRPKILVAQGRLAIKGRVEPIEVFTFGAPELALQTW